MSCAARNPWRRSLPRESGLGLARTEQSIHEIFDDAPNGTGLDRNPDATQHSHHNQLHGRGCQIGPDAVALHNMRTPAERVPRSGTGPGPFGESSPSLASHLQAQDIRGIECMAVSDENTSGSFAVRFGIYLAPLGGYASGVCACRLQSRRADVSAGHRSAAAVGVCRSTQTGSAAYSRRAPFAQTRPRSPRGCADAVRRARGA